MTTGKTPIRFAVLVVNGKNSNYGDDLWIELCVEKILKYAKYKDSLRIFLWNHDLAFHEQIEKMVRRHRPYVLLFSEMNECVRGLASPHKRWREHNPLDWYGFHAHRTALQLLIWKALDQFDPEFFVTFDSDSWPVKKGWDRIFAQKLGLHQLIGVWRDELTQGIEPFVHPSGLGIAAVTIRKHKLRFDTWPVNAREDSLSHISRFIFKRYGKNSIYKLKRSNKVNLHPIFAGVYGDLIYHHHQGTRFTNNMVPIFKGSKARGECIEENQVAIESTTERVFHDYENYMAELRGL